MNIAYSPCPNDTFVFHAWAHGLIPGAPALNVTYADIDITNHLALRREGPEVMKISYAALPWVLSDYALVPCGGALGRGCGPLVLTSGRLAGADTSSSGEGHSSGIDQQAIEPARLDPSMLVGKRVAVPSERSTAYLLFRLWAAQQVQGEIGEIVVMPFHEIMPAVRDGLIDAGLVIHEARFTYQNYGLAMLADLGNWWEGDTGLPIPLGAIIARRSLDLESIAKWTRASVDYAWANPEASQSYVMEHAQEMSVDVAKAHIGLYVNSFTADLGDSGFDAVTSLLARAAGEGLVPEFDLSLLR